MTKGLLLTVGTSFDSEIYSIRALEPAFVAFVCTPTSARFVDEIAAETNLSPVCLRIFEVPDDPAQIGKLASVAHEAYRWLEEKCGPNRALYINPTAGRKWMSTGMTMFAGRTGADIFYVDVQFNDGKPDPATMRLLPLGNADDYTAMFGADEGRALFNRADFEGAARTFGNIRVRGPAAARELYRGLTAISLALGRWDRSEHYGSTDVADEIDAAAHECSTGAAELGIDMRDFVSALAVLAANVRTVSGQHGPSLPAVADLFHNGCRRLANNRADDAVARFYRALEACAQFLLAKRGIDTSKVDWSRLPEDAQEAFCLHMGLTGGTDLPRELALVSAFQLERAISGTESLLFFNNQGKFTFEKYLDSRNHSILAHGWRPVGEPGAAKFRDALERTLVEIGANLEGWTVPVLPRLWS